MKFVIFVSTFIKFVIGMMSPAFPRIQGGIYGNRSSRQGFIEFREGFMGIDLLARVLLNSGRDL